MECHTPNSLPILQPIRLDFDNDDDDDDDSDDGGGGRLEKTIYDSTLTLTVREEYVPRTLGEHNIQRLSALPIYPPFSPITPMTTTTPRKPHLLHANIPSEKNDQRSSTDLNSISL